MMQKFLLLFCLGLMCVPTQAADLTTREKRAVEGVTAIIRKAGGEYKSGKYDAAAASIRKAMKQIDIAVKAGSPALYDELGPAMKRVTQAHAMLELEGVELPPFRKPKRPEAKMEDKPEPASPAAGGISFTKQVAPILSQKCGSCHIRQQKGQFTLATFAALMKGPPEGVVIFAGDTVGSRLIETIETGDMPRGGAKVSAQELKTLKDWINQGAKFDGTDPSAPITAGAAPATPRNKPPEVKLATGKETVSFAADVAPLLVKNCNGCHIGAMQTRGGLRMDTFTQLLRGGDSGEIVMPGKGSESLIVKKLKGEGIEGVRMPAGGRPALSAKEIQLISTWIDEGATLDGASATQPLTVMSQLAWAARATPGELSAKRNELADNSMKLAAAGSAVNEVATEHFFVVGTASENTLKLVGEKAEGHMDVVKSIVAGDEGEKYYRGKATIFVLPGRYQYSEFSKMAESRSIPKDWSSHWRFDGINAYVAVVATDRDDEDAIAQRLYSPLISLAVATRGGDVPRWFAEGVGAAMANRKGNKDRDAKLRREAETSEALAVMKDAKSFLGGKLSPSQTDRIGAAIAESMLDRTRRKSFDACLRQLSSGQPFKTAFMGAFRYPVETYVQNWMKWARGG